MFRCISPCCEITKDEFGHDGKIDGKRLTEVQHWGRGYGCHSST